MCAVKITLFKLNLYLYGFGSVTARCHLWDVAVPTPGSLGAGVVQACGQPCSVGSTLAV